MMTEFELLAIPISLVLGLGVTQILSGVTSAVRGRRSVPLHWLPMAWACLIFVFQFHYFFVLWDLNEEVVRGGATWTWPWFGPAFFHTVLLFLGAGLILPSQREDRGSLLDDFDENGRLALVPLLLALLVAIPLNVYQHDDVWVSQANVLNLGLGVLIIGVLRSKSRTAQGVATLCFALIQAYGVAVVWSKPGME